MIMIIYLYGCFVRKKELRITFRSSKYKKESPMLFSKNAIRSSPLSLIIMSREKKKKR